MSSGAILNKHITASSQLDNENAPRNARLNNKATRTTTGAWTPAGKGKFSFYAHQIKLDFFKGFVFTTSLPSFTVIKIQ